MTTNSLPGQSRRDVLVLGTSALATLGMPVSPALASPGDVEAEIRRRFGNRSLSPGRIKLDLPATADNGLLVPMGFEVDSPMTATDYVKGVLVLAEGNPLAVVAEYRFSPAIPKAAAQMRIRLAQTQNVVVVAEMSDGGLFAAKQEVTVTVGGCGG